MNLCLNSLLKQKKHNKVQEVLYASFQISIKYKTCVREKIRRQTEILNENATEEFLDEICNDSPSVSISNEVSDIKEKYKDIQQLEKSVQLVFQLFVDLAILVHAQGQQINNIEFVQGQPKLMLVKQKKTILMHMNNQAVKQKICCIILESVNKLRKI